MVHVLTKLLCCFAVFVVFISPTWSLNYQKRNLQTITAIYNRTVYPANLAFLQNGTGSVPAGLFNPNASGRVSPLGNFSGFQESTEYFFALAPVPRAPTYVAFTKAQVVEFTSGCPDIAASVVYFTNSVVNATAANNGQYITTLKQVLSPYSSRTSNLLVILARLDDCFNTLCILFSLCAALTLDL